MIPEKLKKGDIVGVIAPSNVITDDRMEAINNSKELIEKAGYKVKFSKNFRANSKSFGASAKEKAEDINEMFKDKEIKAIFSATGGENANITLDYIDYDIIKQNPKIICGFSDTTTLINVIYEKTGLVTFHGANFKSFTSWETEYGFKEVIKRFEKANIELGNPDEEYKTIKAGQAEGILIGGNLSLTTALICGKYSMNFKDKILFLEELGYETNPERASAYLYKMKQNGVFNQIKGIWLGNYTHESNIQIENILLDVLENEYNFPIIKSENFGHIDKKIVIPVGTIARIDTTKDKKIILIGDCVK